MTQRAALIVTSLSLLFATTVSTPSPARAATDAAVTLAAAKKSMGDSAWDSAEGLRFRAEMKTAGLEGTVDQVEDVKRGRLISRYALGPLTGATGDDGTVAWEQDASGQSRSLDAGDTRLRALNDRYLRARGYWYPERWPAVIEALGPRTEGDRAFDVVKVTPEGTRPIELWFDAKSHQLGRTVEKAALETITTSLGDYRDVGGLAIAHTIDVSNGEAQYDQHLRIVEIARLDQLDESAFHMPAPPPPDFTIEGGATSTVVPFELLNGHIFLKVMLDGRGPFSFICDTGGQNILTPEVAKTLGLEVKGALQARGVGEKSADVGFAKIASLGVGGATLSNQLFAVFDLGEIRRVSGVPLDGLVGYEVFKRFVVRLDYEASRLGLTVPSAYQPSGAGVTVPFTFDETHPQVDGSVDGVPGRFTIDTGSRGSLDLLRPFAEKHGFATKIGTTVEALSGWGVGGPVRSRVGRSHELRLGDAVVEAPITMITLNEKGGLTDPYIAGNVGSGVLARFNLTFDYGKKTIVFEPNARYAARDVYDRAGLWLNASDDRASFTVVDVTVGGPAAKAGVAKGDTIVAIDAKPVSGLRLPDVRWRFRSAAVGTEVKLRTQRAGAEREITVTLADQV